MKIGIVGVGHTKFGNLTEDIGELMFKACTEALKDANTTIDKIDVIYIANFSSSFVNQCHLPALLAARLGINKEIIRVESACASGGIALKEAAFAILSGIRKTALVVGVEKMSSTPIEKTTYILASAAGPIEIQHGATFPSLYGLIARAHFNKYQTSERHLAEISVKNHLNATLNPLAHFHKEISVEDVLDSRAIASPLKLLDCSPISDGGAAVVLCNEEIASHVEDVVYIIGIGHDVESIYLMDRKDLTVMPAVINAAQKAYQMCNLTPENIDVAEVHDCFTIAELIEMEDLGFCDKGKAGEMINLGETKIGGRIPINTSGGLKAKGHPIGATGISQVIEIVKQLQGKAGKRQVKDAKVGLCCNIGGSGSTAVVSILSKLHKK